MSGHRPVSGLFTGIVTHTVRRRGPVELWRYRGGGGRFIVGALFEVQW